MSIQIFDDINASHAATGYHGRTDLPAFHIFTIEDTYPTTRQVMMPYTFRFYQIVLLENSADASLNINTEQLNDLTDTLSFASPEHVLAWVRGVAQRGFIIYFKAEFLAHHPAAIQEDFPFFRLTEMNWLRVPPDEKSLLRDECERLLTTFQQDSPTRVPILQARLLVMLYECKRLYLTQQQQFHQVSPRNALVFHFQQLVNQHFLTRKTVEAYAELLHISPDYLTQTVKSVTGQTALDHIQARLLLEAKKLLRYSDLNVGQIAHYLGYAEPTHFGRFFRRMEGMTPLAWRQAHP